MGPMSRSLKYAQNSLVDLVQGRPSSVIRVAGVGHMVSLTSQSVFFATLQLPFALQIVQERPDELGLCIGQVLDGLPPKVALPAKL